MSKQSVEIMAQSSAILLLRRTYPHIRTRMIGKSDESDLLIKAQNALGMYIEQCMTICRQVVKTKKWYHLSLSEMSDTEKHDPQITASIMLVNFVLQQYTPKDPAKDNAERLLILEQLLFLSGRTDSSATDQVIWKGHNAVSNQDELYQSPQQPDVFVVPTVAETLNLVACALQDNERFRASLATDSTDQKDQLNRLNALCRRLLTFPRLVVMNQNQTYSAGLQYELLFLLKGAFLHNKRSVSEARPIEVRDDLALSNVDALTMAVRNLAEKSKISLTMPREYFGMLKLFSLPNDEFTLRMRQDLLNALNENLLALMSNDFLIIKRLSEFASRSFLEEMKRNFLDNMQLDEIMLPLLGTICVRCTKLRVLYELSFVTNLDELAKIIVWRFFQEHGKTGYVKALLNSADKNSVTIEQIVAYANQPDEPHVRSFFSRPDSVAKTRSALKNLGVENVTVGQITPTAVCVAIIRRLQLEQQAPNNRGCLSFSSPK